MENEGSSISLILSEEIVHDVCRVNKNGDCCPFLAFEEREFICLRKEFPINLLIMEKLRKKKKVIEVGGWNNCLWDSSS